MQPKVTVNRSTTKLNTSPIHRMNTLSASFGLSTGRSKAAFIIVVVLVHLCLVGLISLKPARNTDVRKTASQRVNVSIIRQEKVFTQPPLEALRKPAYRIATEKRRQGANVRTVNGDAQMPNSIQISPLYTSPPSQTVVVPNAIEPADALRVPVDSREVRNIMGAPDGEQQALYAPKGRRSQDSILAEKIEKAARPDCKKAYAGLGLLGAPILLKDTLTDKGCKW